MYIYIYIDYYIYIYDSSTTEGPGTGRFCHVDSSIRLDEWKLLGAFHHTDRPDGRARVQFGVVIGRLLVVRNGGCSGIFLSKIIPARDPKQWGGGQKETRLVVVMR